MEIAYYNFGNVKEPLGSIHDDKGVPILEKGEVVVVQDTDAGCEVSKGGGLFGTMVFPDVGSGELYRTDRRIIFLRIPPMTAYATESHGWIDDRRKFMGQAKGWAKKGFRETVVLPIDEVTKTKRKARGKEVIFSVSVGGQKYQVRISPSVRPFI